MVQAVGLPADFAMEVAVQLLDAAGVVVVAEAILRGAAAILDDMDQMVFGEEGQRPEDRGFVERVGLGFEVGQAERMLEMFHGLEDEDTDRRRADSVPQKHLFRRIAAHD